jgi:hypothetical protein
MIRSIQTLAQAKPGLGAAQRTGILTASAGGYQGPVQRAVRGAPLARTALASSISAFRVAMATAPIVAFGRAADARLGHRPTTPAEADARRRAILTGTAATVAIGLVTQRLANHSGRSGPLVEAGRALGSQLAIGGTAGALVVGTDLVLGERGRQHVNRPATALTAGGLIVVVQSRALRRIAPRLTLPTAPRSATIPVKVGWRTGEVRLPLAR